jgi:hypothetical protein
LKVTRFCPTLYPGKKLHLGHLFNLALTLRWANRNNADFFYLIEMIGAERLPNIPEIHGDWRQKNPAKVISRWWGEVFGADVLENICVLQQIRPAPIVMTLFSTVEEQDRLRGVTDIFRGSDCEGAYQPKGIEVHTLPMLSHAQFGHINQFVNSGSLTVNGMMATTKSSSVLDLWIKIIRYSIGVAESADKNQVVYFSPQQWENAPLYPTGPMGPGDAYGLIAEINHLLGAK